MGKAEIILDYFRRYLSEDTAEIESIYQTAAAASIAGCTEVKITSSSFPEGGSASGEFVGNPETIMQVCERLLRELEAVENAEPIEPAGGDPVTHFDFSRRVIRT